MNNIEIQDIGIVLGIALFGAKYDIFDIAFNSNITKTEFLSKYGYNSEYFNKWLDAAVAFDFIKIEEDKLVLTEFGKSFSKKDTNSQLANLIQGVFSVLIANEALPLTETGYRPGYEIINKFQNISPWFDFVNQKKNESIINEIITNELFISKIKNIEGDIADFSCGNGWFIEKIKEQFKNCNFYGVNGKLPIKSTLTPITSEAFFEGENKYNLIVLNKVLHHIWEERDLINNILKKLTKDGILLIWEFNWSDEIKQLPKHREVVFLNLIEHIQNSAFLAENDISKYFNKLGFKSYMSEIDNGKQIIYLIQK